MAGCAVTDVHKAVSARVVSDAAAKTSAAGTARLSMTFVFRRGRRQAIGRRTGIVDSARRRGAIDFDFASEAGIRDSNDLSGEIIYYGDSFYLTSQGVIRRHPYGKWWLKVRRERMTRVVGAGSGISALGSPDPTRPVDYLRAARGEAEMLPDGEVDGVPAKHYRVSVDYRDYVPLAAFRDRVAVAETVDEIGRTVGTTRFPVEVWIAGDGTIRRVRGKLRVRGAEVTHTLELAGIGKPQPVRRPPRIHVAVARRL
jgi:hypothetical protein